MDDSERLTWLEDQLWNGWELAREDGAFVLAEPNGGELWEGESLREVIDAADRGCQ